MKHGLVQKHTVTKGILTPVRLYSKSKVELQTSLLAKMHFQKNSKTNINFALLEYHCLHMAICLTAEKFTQRISDERKPSQ